MTTTWVSACLTDLSLQSRRVGTRVDEINMQSVHSHLTCIVISWPSQKYDRGLSSTCATSSSINIVNGLRSFSSVLTSLCTDFIFKLGGTRRSNRVSENKIDNFSMVSFSTRETLAASVPHDARSCRAWSAVFGSGNGTECFCAKSSWRGLYSINCSVNYATATSSAICRNAAMYFSCICLR